MALDRLMGTVRQPISKLPLVTEVSVDALIPMLEDPEAADPRTVAASVETLLEATAENVLFQVLVRVALFAQGIVEGLLLRYQFPENVTFPEGLGNSIASAAVAATAETVFSIQKNSVEFGTVTFAAAGTEGSFAGDETVLEAGDVLTIEGPMSADTTLNQVSITLAGRRS